MQNIPRFTRKYIRLLITNSVMILFLMLSYPQPNLFPQTELEYTNELLGEISSQDPDIAHIGIDEAFDFLLKHTHDESNEIVQIWTGLLVRFMEPDYEQYILEKLVVFVKTTPYLNSTWIDHLKEQMILQNLTIVEATVQMFMDLHSPDLTQFLMEQLWTNSAESNFTKSIIVEKLGGIVKKRELDSDMQVIKSLVTLCFFPNPNSLLNTIVDQLEKSEHPCILTALNYLRINGPNDKIRTKTEEMFQRIYQQFLTKIIPEYTLYPDDYKDYVVSNIKWALEKIQMRHDGWKLDLFLNCLNCVDLDHFPEAYLPVFNYLPPLSKIPNKYIYQNYHFRPDQQFYGVFTYRPY